MNTLFYHSSIEMPFGISNLYKDLTIDISLVSPALENLISSLTRDNLDDVYDIIIHMLTDKSIIHPDWSMFAGRMRIHQLKNMSGLGDPKRYIPLRFSDATRDISSALDPGYARFVDQFKDILDAMIIEDNDMNFNIFAVETLTKSYLYKYKHINKIVRDSVTGTVDNFIKELDSIVVDTDTTSTIKESPQYMYMRVAVFLYMDSNDSLSRDPMHTNIIESRDREIMLQNIYNTYRNLSNGMYIQASPTMFNAGFKRHQMSSCFLLHPDDDMVSITKSWKDSALISMNTGAIGIDLSRLRHSSIGNSGESHGILPWAKIYNSIIPEVDQGGGKRKGSSTLFLQPWHKDIVEFVELKNPEGKDSMRARDLFYALWIPDEFMRRVEDDKDWTLFCPHEAPGLVDLYGSEFEKLYRKYEDMATNGKIPFKRLKARYIWNIILDSQIKTGGPFMLYGDSCNRKSNQQNLGTITHSNLCVEIIEYTDKDNIASCNLASISLPRMVSSVYVKDSVGYGRLWFNFKMLDTITRELVRNINRVIDRNYYHKEIPQIRDTNDRNRPIGIGVQGLDDVFAMMDILWDSDTARELNSHIFEQIYYSAMSESYNEAQIYGCYPTFKGSPLSNGFFQFDLYNLEQYNKRMGTEYRATVETFEQMVARGVLDNTLKDSRHLPTIKRRLEAEFDRLRTDIRSLDRNRDMVGVRNSLLIALMPTASTSSILGNNECIEPRTQNIYARTVLSGKFPIVNQHLVEDLLAIDMWNIDTINSIIKNNGSIHQLDFKGRGPITIRGNHLKKKYRTVYELNMKTILDLAIDRGKYVCQSQSLNCFMSSPLSFDKLTKYHYYGWMHGLKTGMYYLRTQLATGALSITSVKDIGKDVSKNRDGESTECLVCSS